MSATSKIEWTDATWNPIRGCSEVSPGCANCYAKGMAARFSGEGKPYEGLAYFDDRGRPHWTGQMQIVPNVLEDPFRWKKPRMIFVNSMSDLFHEQIHDDQIEHVAQVMADCPQHTFQVLTKRSERLRDLLRGRLRWVTDLENIWWGVSVENRRHGLPRMEDLRRAPAAIKFLSIEPLLEDLGSIDLNGFSWVIVGGESGPGARPMHPDWVRSIRDQCQAAGVPFFFKQWGAWLPWEPEAQEPFWRSQSGRSEDAHGLFPADWDAAPNWDDGLWAIEQSKTDAVFQRVGKKAAGRSLDGNLHDAMPTRVNLSPSSERKASDS